MIPLTGERIHYKCIGDISLELCEATVITTYKDIVFAVNDEDFPFLLDVQDLVDADQVELWRELATVVKVRESAEKREAAIRSKLR